MNKRLDLTQGPILGNLIAIALPIMGTSFVQMAYNMADMMWIGRVGYDAVSAVGTAGFYMWLSMSLVRLSQVGAEVGVSQSLGAKDEGRALRFGRNALQFAVFNALLYTLLILVLKKPLIDFFAIPNPVVNTWGVSYLGLVALGMPFSFAGMVFSSIYNGSGNSRTPLIFNVVGLVFNIIVDPILIFGWLGLPKMGVTGAALATVLAQILVAGLFAYHIKSSRGPLKHFTFFKVPCLATLKEILKVGMPVAIQSGAFTVFAMLIARRLSAFGDMPIAVQKVGSQIESLSWMTAMGFSTALSAFVGQNYGAKAYGRIKAGYQEAFKIMLVLGAITTFVLIAFAEPIFAMFIPDPKIIPHGAVYLRILGVSQLFMCLEIATSGAFNGLGRTTPPSVVSIVFTGLRVPAAYLLSASALLGLNGVWWSISASSIIKGLVVTAWFVLILKRDELFKGVSS